uniref:Uncharacterized protein n=1 Tax=viral metagenome TaxID=1070528 RepID=A0A6M3JST9_9ZZZZ
MIRTLFKFAKIPDYVNGTKPIVIDTTSGSGEYRELSPFVLPAPPAKNLENLWQFSKVYNKYIMPIDGYPDASYYKWRDWGFNQDKAYRYPMGKGAIPEYSLWDDEKLDYIQARKKIYATEYAKNVLKTNSFRRLDYTYQRCLNINKELILLDYDAYDHIKLGMTLADVINNPKRKMGHAFVLIMMLTGFLEECVNS